MEESRLLGAQFENELTFNPIPMQIVSLKLFVSFCVMTYAFACVLAKVKCKILVADYLT